MKNIEVGKLAVLKLEIVETLRAQVWDEEVRHNIEGPISSVALRLPDGRIVHVEPDEISEVVEL